MTDEQTAKDAIMTALRDSLVDQRTLLERAVLHAWEMVENSPRGFEPAVYEIIQIAARLKKTRAAINHVDRLLP